MFSGAWWFNKCHQSDLNGYNYNDPAHNSDFGKGINWMNKRKIKEQDLHFSWPNVEMKIIQQE